LIGFARLARSWTEAIANIARFTVERRMCLSARRR
jgi:hypothetical protein